VPVIPYDKPLSLDALRDDPGQLMTANDIAATGIISSYGGLSDLVRAGILPEPFRLGRRRLWEARDVLGGIERSRSTRAGACGSPNSAVRAVREPKSAVP
jgi:hypothetical protein